MTKKIEPSKATIKAFGEAAMKLGQGWPEDAARIIQRHVDLEVLKARKEDAEIVRCAEEYTQACEDKRGCYVIDARDELIAAVNAKKGRKE